MRKRVALGILSAALVGSATAQSPTPAPTPAPTASPPRLGAPQAVEAAPLSQDAFSTGTLARGAGALEPTLWKRADPNRLALLLDAAPARPATPALGEALRRTLLTSGEAPQGATPSLGGRKLLALVRAGHADEALTIASLSNAPKSDPFVGQALATADLLQGNTAEACKRNAALGSGRDTPFWVKLRVLCFSIAAERDAADLSLTLLREQGFLSETDDALLKWVASGVSPRGFVAPQNALHLAILRHMGASFAPGMFGAAEAGVVKAIANDPSLAPPVRVDAAVRAAAMGAMTGSELTALFFGFDVDLADAGRAPEAARARHDPMGDVILYHSVKAMSAPEFLRDKATRIADALSFGDTFARAYAAAVIYGEDIAALEGAIVAPSEAGEFALARMAVGDGDGAARWLFAMFGSGGASALSSNDAARLADLTSLLAVLDPISAKAVAEAANVTLAPRVHRPASRTPPLPDQETSARIVESAFDAAIDESQGQAALSALAASTVLGAGDPVGRVVVSQSLRAAGFNELRRRMDFEAVWNQRFQPEATELAPAAPPKAEAPAAAGAAPPQKTESGSAPTPRLKPKRAGEG